MKKDKPYRPIAPFARAFKKVREAHGISQNRIAKIAKCNVSFICATEHSLRPPFPFGILSNIIGGIEDITDDEKRLLSSTAQDENPRSYPIPCDVMMYLIEHEDELNLLLGKIYKKS